MARNTTDTQKRTPEPTQAEYRKMEEETVVALKEQEKTRIRLYQVPDDSSDMPLPDVTVAVNGYVYVLQRGVSIDVPQTVLEILEQAGHV